MNANIVVQRFKRSEHFHNSYVSFIKRFFLLHFLTQFNSVRSQTCGWYVAFCNSLCLCPILLRQVVRLKWFGLSWPEIYFDGRFLHWTDNFSRKRVEGKFCRALFQFSMFFSKAWGLWNVTMDTGMKRDYSLLRRPRLMGKGKSESQNKGKPRTQER